jgi:endonuclease/exonuclease/phosphatase family metal-dependent hydrolase
MFRRLFFVIFVSAIASACVRTMPPAMRPALSGSCRVDTIQWFAPEDAGNRARLDSWCSGVGAPAVHRQALDDGSGGVTLLDVTFVSWNVHVGNGNLGAFVDDLRAGVLTGGRPVHHFVLMLQEAVRTEGVPAFGSGASGAARIKANARAAIDIVEECRTLGLSLVYVPSMRNGNSADEDAADRGSAILSTLPLVNPTAIELPGERQRRVVVMAQLASVFDSGSAVSVGVIHLDALGALSRLWLFGTTWMRELQMQSIKGLLPEGTLVLGADLNTWHGTSEPVVRSLERLFADTPVTLKRQGLGLRVLDYMFFRAGTNRTARYQQVAESYGSDHRPLIGWIE